MKNEKHSKWKKDNKGFTLMEALIVLVIMGMVMSISIPMFKVFREGSKLSSGSRTVTAALRTARSLAIVNRAVYMVNVAVNNKQFGIYYNDGEIGMDKAYYLPDGIEFDDNYRVSFNPDGSANAWERIIINNTINAETVTINVYQTTGAIKID